MNTDTSKKSAELKSRINNYLENGGFFNPEHMDHEKVSELLLECRDFLASVPQGVVIFTKEMADAWGFKKDPSDEVWYPEDAKFSRCNPNCEEFQEREIYRRSRPAPQPVVEDLKVIITKFEPDYLTLKQERDALRQQLEEAKKDNQTIKSTLENKRRELQMFHRALNETEAKLSQRGTGRLTVLQVKSDVTYFFPATCVDGREEFWEGLTNELNALLTSPWRSVESDPPQEKDADRNGAVLVLFPHGSVQYEPWGVVHKMKTAAGWMPIPPLPAQ
jgi:uncharacterized membrane protein